MKIVHTIDEVRAEVGKARRGGRRIGFVPTMGYLHQGHLSLVEISKRHSDYQTMSIFVNRIQFNDPKDFEKYPVDLGRDFELARGAGVDLVFVPEEGEMYRDRLTYVDMDTLTTELCGAHRPGHFRGVFTVVSKLFNIVLPDVAVFGQKDIQQAVSIEKMVFDLNFPVEIIIAPTVREEGGLAMSSRNKHLSADERARALCIVKSLRRAEELLASGERNAGAITGAMRAIIESGKPQRIDYVSAVAYADLQPIDRITGKSVIAVAAYFGPTRLIDNMIIDMHGNSITCVY